MTDLNIARNKYSIVGSYLNYLYVFGGTGDKRLEVYDSFRDQWNIINVYQLNKEMLVSFQFNLAERELILFEKDKKTVYEFILLELSFESIKFKLQEVGELKLIQNVTYAKKLNNIGLITFGE